MREQGVANFPQPNFSGHGSILPLQGFNTSTPQFANALAKCRPELALALNRVLHALLHAPAGSGQGTT